MRAIRLRRAAIGLVALLAVVGLALIGCQLVEGGSGEADRDDGPGRAGRAEHDRVGREGGRHSLDFYSETSNICIKV